MARGAFREAFARIVDVPVGRPDELFCKIALMADSGIALRDGSILEYGLYLLEYQKADILAVPSLAPFYWVNLANLRANLLAIQEAEGGKRCWYDRTVSAPARRAYKKAYETAGDDASLKVRILAAHGRFLMGLGRDWEAFGLFNIGRKLNASDKDCRLGRVETLAKIAGTAPALENDLLREAADQLNEYLDDSDRDESAETLAFQLSERLGVDGEREKLLYPKNTIITDSEREHSMVIYSLKHNLYLTPCATCRLCDRSVGDAAALGAQHAVVGGGGRYRKMALLTGRLTERYRALRAALIDHCHGTELPDAANNHPHFPEVEGWRPLPSATASLLNSLPGGTAVLEGMAYCVALFLGRETRGPIKIDHILGSPGAPGSGLIGQTNPALHGFWDLWADGVEGLIKGADLPELVARALSTEAVEHLALDSDALSSRSLSLLGWLRNLIGYLILMTDRDARGDKDAAPLWLLQPFLLPKK